MMSEKTIGTPPQELSSEQFAEWAQDCQRRQDQAFLDKLYLAVLPAAMGVEGMNLDARAELAAQMAVYALKHRPIL